MTADNNVLQELYTVWGGLMTTFTIETFRVGTYRRSGLDDKQGDLLMPLSGEVATSPKQLRYM